MKKSILLSHLLVLFIILSISLITVSVTISNFAYSKTEEELTNAIEEISRVDSYIDISSFNDYLVAYDDNSNTRVTIIDLDGVVVFDTRSEAAEMENHYYREEVRTAIEDSTYIYSIRTSETISVELMYTAQVVDIHSDTVVLRVSRPVSSVNELTKSLVFDIVLILIIGGVFAYIISLYMSRKIVKSLNELVDVTKRVSEGSYDVKIETKSYKEINELGQSFRKMSKHLSELINKYDLRKAELLSVINTLGVGLLVVDQNGSIILHNEYISKFYKISHDIINKDISDNFFDKSIYEVLEMSKTKSEVRISNIRNSQGQFLTYIGRPIFLKNGELIGTLLLIEDVTKIQRLENMRRDFVSNVTHELKTPLTSIIGFTETLKNIDPSDEETNNKFLSIIELEAERLMELINEILVLQEIEELPTTRMSQVNINEIIKEAIDLLKGNMSERVELQTSIPNKDIYLKTNSEKFKQIVVNLISNAIKYTNEGNIHVDLTEDESSIKFTVKDTGIGISDDNQSRIFERFYRVDSARHRKTGGTGLGLAIVKHLVELLNAEIHVESQLEKGSIFTITFPK